jgi:arginase family enzyme
MKIQIIKIPYDCGYKEQRQGLGPGRFTEHNLDRILEADGHQVNISQIDMDAFEIGGGAANHFGATGGMSPEFLIRAIALVKDHIPVRGCAIASYDPAFDRNGKFVEAGIQSIRKIAGPID